MSARRGWSGAGLGLVVVALGAAACAPMGPGGHHPHTSTVTVAGTGTVSAAPDMAEITTGVVTQAPTAAQALAANSQAMERLLQALGGLGVAARDIQTTNISVSPLRRQGRDGPPPEITGYEVTNQVRVKVRDLSRLGRVLDQQVGRAPISSTASSSGGRSPRRCWTKRASARWRTRGARRSSTRPPPP